MVTVSPGIIFCAALLMVLKGVFSERPLFRSDPLTLTKYSVPQRREKIKAKEKRRMVFNFMTAPL
jgi:hypothetical protein